MPFIDGNLFLTRTPGRRQATAGRHVLNSITLREIIYPDHLNSAFCHAFFIAQDEFFQYFDFNREGVPIYISRDFYQDGDGQQAAKYDSSEQRLPRPRFTIATEKAAEYYARTYGTNFKARYPHMSTGCSHSKVLVLEYASFLRVVVTSANFMDCDTEMGDNVSSESSWLVTWHNLPTTT